MKCPYNSEKCLCQSCANNTMCHQTCDDCREAGEAVHDVWSCSAYKPNE